MGIIIGFPGHTNRIYISVKLSKESLSPVKSPICSFDAKSGVLCSKCETKLRTGEISQDDVDASIRLTRLAERNGEVNKFTLTRAVKLGEETILVLKASDVNAVRGSEEIAHRIESELGRKTWFIESEASDRGFIETLFYPTKVFSVNLLWLPDGTRLTKVMAAGSADRSRTSPDKIRKIAKAIRDIELLIEYES